MSRRLDEITVADVFDALGRPGWSGPTETNDHPDCPVERAVNIAIGKAEAEAARHVLMLYRASTLDDIARDALIGE
ncbi:hypothetical protein D3C87_1975610 [compost metagenome]